jgi:transposase
MRAYSIDLRERVLADADAGLGARGVAAKYRVSESWVRRLKQRRRETGRVAPRPRGPNRHTKLGGRADELRRLVAAQPDATLAELQARLPVRVSLGTLWAALHALKLRFKKKSGGRPSRTART